MAEVKPENKPAENKPKLSQEEEWKQLMNEPDPLAETDIYAGEKQEAEKVQTVNPEDTELDDDIGSLLDKSFKTEKSKSSLVNNIP